MAKQSSSKKAAKPAPKSKPKISAKTAATPIPKRGDPLIGRKRQIEARSAAIGRGILDQM